MVEENICHGLRKRLACLKKSFVMVEETILGGTTNSNTWTKDKVGTLPLGRRGEGAALPGVRVAGQFSL
eukprot:2209866-Pleurochrysis_carterae.AAC.1